MTAVYVVGYWDDGRLLPLSVPLGTSEEARDLLGEAIAKSYVGDLDPALVSSLGVAKVTPEWLASYPGRVEQVAVAA